MTLKKKALLGVKWTGVSTILVTLLQLGQLSILARYLQPSDFGLMAVVMVVVGFSKAFEDMGLSNAIIQRPEVTHIQLSSLYWLNIASGLLLTLIALAVAPLLALVYSEPRLLSLMMVISSVFLVVAVGNQFRVLCQKELRFKVMESVNVIASGAAFIGAVVSAVSGLGVWSLVFAMLIQATVSSILFLCIGLKKYHKPALIYKHSELKGFFGFGLYQMGERSINYISANADKLIISKLVGMNATGFYNLAWQLIIFPLSKINPIVNKVAFPVYSKVQTDHAVLNHYYSFNVKALSMVTMPLLAFLVFFSGEVVRVVFGDGWRTTEELLPALAMVGIMKAIGNPGGALILALGRADVGFWWNIIWAISIVSGLIIGLLISPSANTAVYVLLGLSVTVGIFWHVLIARIAKVEYWPIAMHFLKLFVVVMSIGWLGSSFTDFIGVRHDLIRIFVGALICVLLYSLYLYLFEKPMFRIFRRSS